MFGKFNIEGLPKVSNTYFELSLINSTVSPEDLYPYATPQARRELNKFGIIRFNSDFEGQLDNFMAQGNFRTEIGRLDGTLNYLRQNGTPSYEGQLEATNLDLGVLMEDPENFQKQVFRDKSRVQVLV